MLARFSRAARSPGPLFLACFFLVCALVACSDTTRAPFVGPSVDGEPKPADPAEVDPCAHPKQGCECARPGEQAACGQVAYRSGDYVTCSVGTLRCGDDGAWGECLGDRVFTTKDSSEDGSKTLALGDPSGCADPCDPNCVAFEDDGLGLDDALPGVLCETGGGVGVCPTCGYSVPHADSATLMTPAAWSTQPASCTADDQCSFDQQCRQGSCQNWRYPCSTTAATCPQSDLTVGPPCSVAMGGFHLPICNRGSVRADTGTLRIGLYADSARLGQCASAAYAAPDSGLIEFELSADAGRYIDPGQCLDISSGNADLSGIDLAGVRGAFVNFDASLADCNLCNNWQAFDPSAACTGCTNLQCNQTCAATSLTGTIFDPGSVNPLPDVMVYVPNEPVTAFVENLGCDTCENLVSGAPITSTMSRFDGSFELTNVPAGVSFPLVIQTGRWRRQVTVPAIPACGSAVLPAASAHLPRNQAEGDIPKLALVMGDADPIQCLFRKIGISPSEMTSSEGSGRIHLYNHNGMKFSGSRAGFTDPATGPVALLSDPVKMAGYSAIFAPCDYKHTYPSAARSRSGPSYNSPPQASTTPVQRANVKSYLDRGGRLFTSHWLSQDFVHLIFDPPAATPVATPSPSGLLAGIGWTYAAEDQYNPTAPAQHLFGRNVEADRDPPGMVYRIDTSTPVGSTFAEWANVVGASPDGEETVTFDSWSRMVSRVNPRTVRLAYGDSATALGRPQQACRNDLGTTDPNSCRAPAGRYWGGPHTSLFQFDTPWGATENQCGRVVVAQSHVAQHACRMPSSTPPVCTGPTPDCACSDLSVAGGWASGCGAGMALAPQEKAMEFLIFQTTQCIGRPSPPQAPVALSSATFTRDYESNCPSGQAPRWRFFQWQANVPAGTSLQFSAATAATQGELAGAESVSLGEQSSSTTGWVSSAETVHDTLLADEPPLTSQKFLRIRVQFDTNDLAVTPVLTNWKQTYDCVDAE